MYRKQSFAQHLHCVPPEKKLSDISADDNIKESLYDFIEIQKSSEMLKSLKAKIPHILLFNSVEYAQAFSGELTSVGWDYLVIDPFDFVFLSNEEYKKNLTNALNEIIISAPCVVLCENINVLAPNREKLSCSVRDYARNSFFLALLDDLCSADCDFVFIGVCENMSALNGDMLKRAYHAYNVPLYDKAYRAGFFEKEFENIECDDSIIAYLADLTSDYDTEKLNRLVFCIKNTLVQTLKKDSAVNTSENGNIPENKKFKLSKEIIDIALYMINYDNSVSF